MSLERANKYCPHCNASRYAERNGVNHILHLLIGVFTCGLWWFIWAALAIFGETWRCVKCGKSC